MTENKYYCYILKSKNPLYPDITYNGSTNNMERRLRQHNGDCSGGAKATKGKGPWIPYIILEGFECRTEALSCEWRIKHPTNKKIRPKCYCGVEGRIKSLNIILNLDRWTNKVCLSNGLESGKNYKLYIEENYINLIGKIKENVEIINIENFNKN